MKRCTKCARVFDDDSLDRCSSDGAALRPVVDPLVGRRVGGRYRIQRRLGSGGMSTVYLSEELLTGQQVALKVLRQDLTRDPVQRDRFVREAKAIRRVVHENIVEVIDFDDGSDGLFYLVMEYVPGESLHERLQKGPLASRIALGIARQVTLALTRTHQLGVVHRDLKPENIILVRGADGEERVKVLDFGIAKVRDFETLTGSLQIIGTPGYIAPEYIQANSIDGRADLFSLGVVMYEMATGGRPPFDYKYKGDLLVKPLKERPIPPSQRQAGIEPALETLILRALERDPAHRFRDAFHMREAIDAVLAGLDAASPRSRTTRRFAAPDDPPAVDEAPSVLVEPSATQGFARALAGDTVAAGPRELTSASEAAASARHRLEQATRDSGATSPWRIEGEARLGRLEGAIAGARWLALEAGAVRRALREARALHGTRTDELAEEVSHIAAELERLAERRRALQAHGRSDEALAELTRVERALVREHRRRAAAQRKLDGIRGELDAAHELHGERLRQILVALEGALRQVEAAQARLDAAFEGG